MSSATLSTQETYAAGHGAAFAASELPSILPSIRAAAYGGWLRRPGTAASVALHGAALLAIWALSSGVVKVPAVPPVVELIRLQPEPKPELTPPKPQPVADKPLAPPKPATQAVPVPKTVAASAAQAEAETYTPPATPVQAAPIGPV